MPDSTAPSQRSAVQRVQPRIRRCAAVLAVLFMVAACSESDVKTTESTPPRQTTTVESSPAPTAETTSSEATDPTDDDVLASLPDVTEPEWTPETRTDELAVQIGSKPLTPQQAIDALALLYPDTPGATPTSLPPGPGLDATYTWMLVRREYDQLAPDQRAFVDQAAASDPIGTIGPDGTVATPLAEQVIAGVGDPPADETEGTVLASPPEPTTATNVSGGFAAPRRASGKQTLARYLGLATKAYQDWQAHRKDLPPFTIQLALNQGPATGMDTGPVNGVPHACVTRVATSFVAQNHSDALIKFYFAHEMFHCIQDQWNGSYDWTAAKWLVDGSADFAAVDVYRNVYVPAPPDLENTWFGRPGKPLAARWYDAWALFETLHQEGTDVIQMVHNMITNFAGGDVAANLANGGMDGELFRMKWSSRSLRSKQLPADDWQLVWPGPNRNAGPHDNRRDDGTRGIGQYDVKVNGGYTHVQKLVHMDAKVGIIDVTPTGGPLTTQTADGVIHVADGSTVRLCFSPDGCKCPEETESGARQMTGRQVIFSFAASAQPTMAHVEARPWDEKTKKLKCRKKPSPRAASNGDPHLVTFDGLPFDMMTLGEFVMSRDASGDFEVQTRNVSPPTNPAGTLSSGVAISTGRHRVTLQAEDVFKKDTVVARVDGQPVSAARLDLDGVLLQRSDQSATLTWPDGTVVDAEWHTGYFVTITPSDARAARLTGVLGAADGDFVNDLRMPDGTIVDPVHAAVPDSAFSKAWRVTKQTSLFDYATGQSVDTFALPYPSTARRPDFDSGTEDRCRQALGPNAANHEIRSCTFDVTVMASDTYLDAYRQVVADRVAAETGAGTAPDTSAPSPPSSVAEPAATGTPVLSLSGTLIASYSPDAAPNDVATLTGTVKAKSGTVMLVHAERCAPGATLFLTVTKHDSGQAGNTFICDANGLLSAQARPGDEVVAGEISVWLPSDGEYDVEISTDATVASFVKVDVYADADPTILDGSALAKTGYKGSLAGIGDTVVITGTQAVGFTATGLEKACVQQAYGAEPPGSDSVWPLAGFCAHPETVSLPGADVPLVIFSRISQRIDFTLTGQ